ncbi:L,D-transpeptidase family protein [Alkaliphilus hydrothermalis]|uniref:Peptidoglycan hydrolase-like protein with peptidoglycan-binding domain n=1 Tax=Alkaliphilus hydrothermalis TaxID=1482730 RepID=A0ABS2NTK0_9FIRM|nr:peptidoglycan-binding protein [Alkaliphilus hydrothermalis]MBM7616283.1 peptidoglycan hydrolase-like protein with peptidoglycan-binding domain [Alkaliphilus hydrothermalis]
MILASRYLRLLDPYMEGPDVKHVQERLTELGYYNGPIDSIYDEEVFEAVRTYQADFGLSPDGIMGPDTWNSIGLSPDEYYPLPPEGYSIEIDLSKKILVLKKFSEVITSYPVAVGKPATPTPKGDWKIIQKTLNPGGPFGTRWMRLNVPWGGYGIHGTDTPTSIGTAASNGCIRMFNEDVEALYDIVPLGTPVKIIGNGPVGRILSVGVEPGSDIFEVKANLTELGYYDGEINGVFGEDLREAVIAFQRDFNLAADGIVGADTYDKIQLAVDQLSDSREP